jgi:hypothetical protein
VRRRRVGHGTRGAARADHRHRRLGRRRSTAAPVTHPDDHRHGRGLHGAVPEPAGLRSSPSRSSIDAACSTTRRSSPRSSGPSAATASTSG